MTIYFQNPGEIDPRLITTLGVNVKESDSPVGFFGTGLKYALAVLLREHHEVTIWSGERKFSFRKVQDVLRGKEFNFIHMTEGEQTSPLGFTTELGKNWTVANAYRELYCNAKDEGGGVIERATPIAGSTLIEVSGSAFEQIHLTRDEFLLSPKLTPLSCSNDALKVFPIPSSQIFFRGIAARTLQKNSVLRYNLISAQELTEDRTLKYPYFVDSAIAVFITKFLSDPVALHTILTTECFEHELDLTAWNCEWSDHFLAAVRLAIRAAPTKVDSRVTSKFFEKKLAADEVYTEITLNAEQEERLAFAKEFLCSCGFSVTNFKIIPVEYLGENILGMADHRTRTIRVSSLAFSHPDELVRTLLEEFVHLNFHVQDETRMMQNALISQLHRVSAELFKYQKKFGLSITLDDDIPF